jgi:hypothetical protein
MGVAKDSTRGAFLWPDFYPVWKWFKGSCSVTTFHECLSTSSFHQARIDSPRYCASHFACAVNDNDYIHRELEVFP